jgi:hypothetical protein
VSTRVRIPRAALALPIAGASVWVPPAGDGLRDGMQAWSRGSAAADGSFLSRLRGRLT